MRYALLFFSLFLLTLGISAQSEIPYVYYYAETLNAIVVERADGSDSRLLGQGIIPETHNMLVWSEWSPSGKWLAWISGTREFEGGRGYAAPRIGLINADGTQRMTLLDTFTNVVSVAWSPNGDYLLIVEYLQDDRVTPIYLIDARNSTIIATINDIYYEFASWGSRWSEDGANLSFPYLTENREWRYRLLYLDAHTEDIADSTLIAPRYIPPVEDDDLRDNLISPDTKKTFDRETLSIYDENTGLTTQLRPFSGAASAGVCGIVWHPDSEWLFFTMNMTWAGGVGSYCGANLIKADGTVQREIGACNLYNACANWLPERVLPYLSLGQAQSLVPEPFLLIPHEGRVMSVAWHPSQNTLATYEERDNDAGVEYFLHLWETHGDNAVLKTSFPVGNCYDWVTEECLLIWNSSGTKIALAGWNITQILELETGEILDSQSQYFAGWINADDYLLAETLADYDAQNNLLAKVTSDFGGVELTYPNNLEIVASYFPVSDRRVFITSLQFIPNLEALAIILNREPNILIWHYYTNRIVPLNRMGINDINVNPSGDLLFGYGLFSPVIFWNPQTGAVISRLNRYAPALAFSPNGQYIATASSTVAEIWNAEPFLP